MLGLEFLQQVHLLLVVTGRLPHLLLPLIIHHLFHHAAGLPVQVAQFGILRHNFRGINRVGRITRYTRPPFHFVRLVQVYADLLLLGFRRGRFDGGWCGGGFKGPGGFGRNNWFRQWALMGKEIVRPRSVILISSQNKARHAYIYIGTGLDFKPALANPSRRR